MNVATIQAIEDAGVTVAKALKELELLHRLKRLGVRVFPEASIAEVGDGHVIIKTGQGLEVTVAADAIVDGAEMQPNTALVDGLSSVETYTVGDAAAPFNIATAIRSGNDVGRAI